MLLSGRTKGLAIMTLEEKMAVIRNNQGEPPVNVVHIANELGLHVYRASGWPNELSGMIKRTEADGAEYEIYVNADHPPTRRRFTIAHEVAHFILHHGFIGDGITDDALYRSGLSNKQEAQANRLAADILMPWSLLDALINDGETDIARLAGAFNVSKSAMSIRLGVPYD